MGRYKRNYNYKKIFNSIKKQKIPQLSGVFFVFKTCKKYKNKVDLLYGGVA